MNDLQLLKKRANVKRLFDTLCADGSTQPETADDLAYMLAQIDDEIARRKMAAVPDSEFAKFAGQFYQSLESGESYAQRVHKGDAQ